tara:strand:- start:1688 stop:2011 length:324 start_codon:yes stop_codon:yes gene_type:complete
MKNFLLIFILSLSFNTMNFASFPVFTEVNSESLLSTKNDIVSPDSIFIGFLLGFFMGPLGILIAYLMFDRRMGKAAIKGFLLSVLLAIILVTISYLALLRADPITLY